MVTWTFIELEYVGSTQSIAKSYASMGAPEGTTIVAKSQSSGEGRLGREWSSPPGGLYMSFILRPEKISRPELASLISALAVVQGVKSSTGLKSRIRWPNDVMVENKKLAGIIAEGHSYRGEITQLVVGIGVNCNNRMKSSKVDDATSLVDQLGKNFEVSEIKNSILDSFSSLYLRWRAGDDMMPLWKAHVGTIGKKLSVKPKTGETAFPSRAVGVDADGGLKLDNGETLRPEDVEWIRETP